MAKTRCLVLPIVFLLLIQNAFGQPQTLDKFIESYVKAHNFSGTILIRKTQGIRYAKSFGWANRQFKVPNKIDTKYKVASITKAFTAVLILRLYEQELI